LCLKCVLSYFQEELVGFDRKEDFRSSFKEDRKSNEAPKRCRKQGEAAHGRAPGSTAVLQWQYPCTDVRPPCVGTRPVVRPGTAGPCPCPSRPAFFLPTYLSSLHFLADWEASFESTLGRKLGFSIASNKPH